MTIPNPQPGEIPTHVEIPVHVDQSPAPDLPGLRSELVYEGRPGAVPAGDYRGATRLARALRRALELEAFLEPIGP